MPRLPRVPALLLVAVSILSVQVGAAIGKSLFAQVTPVGVAWLRLTAAALLLLVLARPRLRGRSRGDWLNLAAFTVALVAMNTTIYLAFAHIPIGIAVTLEFLGPLAVALAGSRRLLDVVWVVLAGVGVALLGLNDVRLEPVGVGFALVAGACWAGYIVLGERVGRSWVGVDAISLACAAGSVALAAPAWLGNGAVLVRPGVVVAGIGLGLLSSAIPYSCELAALRRIPKPVFGILMSVEPAVAALAALVILGERLTGRQLLAMACVIAASAGATWFARRRSRAAVPRD